MRTHHVPRRACGKVFARSGRVAFPFSPRRPSIPARPTLHARHASRCRVQHRATLTDRASPLFFRLFLATAALAVLTGVGVSRAVYFATVGR